MECLSSGSHEIDKKEGSISSRELLESLQYRIQRGIVPKAGVFFVRHGRSLYSNYTQWLSSDQPQRGFHESSQHMGDISDEGAEVATKEAKNLLSQLDPQEDILFFVSSNEIRALETALIYEKIATKMGFKIIKQGHKRKTSIPGFDSESNIRVYSELGLNFDSVILYSVFNPQGSPIVDSINRHAIDSDFRERYDRARGVVLADDKGSFGQNYYIHANAVKQILSAIHTPQELDAGQLSNLLKLVAKVSGRLAQRRVKVIAFGHENYRGEALHDTDGNPSIGNCEVLSIVNDKEKSGG